MVQAPPVFTWARKTPAPWWASLPPLLDQPVGNEGSSGQPRVPAGKGQVLLSAQHWGAHSGCGNVPRVGAAEAALGLCLRSPCHSPRGGVLPSDEIWATRRARHKISSSWYRLALWGGGGGWQLSEPFCSQICFLFM